MIQSIRLLLHNLQLRILQQRILQQSNRIAMSNPPNQTAFQMLWDCRTCGQEKLLGVTHRYCPGCGSPQEPKARYFPSDDDKVVVENHKFVGKDRRCPACETPNAAQSSNCMSCGFALDGAKEVVQQEDVVTRQGEHYDAAFRHERHRQHTQQALKTSTQAKKTFIQAKKNQWVLFGVIALVGVVLLSLYHSDSTLDLQVVKRHWERSILIERFMPVSEGQWCQSLPAGAMQVSRSQKVKDYRSIPDGQSCQTRRVDNGDGTFHERRECETLYRQEPIYASWCSYRINRWQVQRTAVSSGNGEFENMPAWPAFQLASIGRCVGCEREGRKSQRYSVYFTDQRNKEHRCEFSHEQWQQYQKQSTWKATSNLLTGLDCGSLLLDLQ